MTIASAGGYGAASVHKANASQRRPWPVKAVLDEALLHLSDRGGCRAASAAQRGSR